MSEVLDYTLQEFERKVQGRNGRFRAPLRIVISLLIWTYSIEELLNIFDHFMKNKGFYNIITDEMTGREVVVEDYGPGDLLLQVEWHMPNSTGGS